MCDQPPCAEASGQRLRDVLIRYLRAADSPSWPGADGLTVQEVLRSYPRAAALGRVPSRQDLLARYPELAAELNDFFGEPAGSSRRD